MANVVKRFSFAAALLGLVAGVPATATAGTINVLWYTGGVREASIYFTSYQDMVNDLVKSAPSAPGGNTWNVTYWNSGAEPTAPAGGYNVLVTASPEGPWFTDPNFSALTTAASSITLGDRIMLTGQDADWHEQSVPGPANFDGPKGFLLNSINWAGSGNGLGAVFLGGYTQTGFTLTGVAQSDANQDDVRIPTAFASFPINTNLTTKGLSSWATSAHRSYTISDTTMWTGINTSGDSTTQFVTVVSAQSASGGVTAIPEPSTLVSAVLAVLAGSGYGWRHRRVKAAA